MSIESLSIWFATNNLRCCGDGDGDGGGCVYDSSGRRLGFMALSAATRPPKTDDHATNLRNMYIRY